MTALRVEPSEIVFDAVEPGNLYVMTFSVRNISPTAQRIRLQAPKSSIFALNYIPSTTIAPGLDLRAEVECLIPKEITGYKFLDHIVASIGEEKVNIPVKAFKPALDIEYPKSLQFGPIQQHQQLTKEINFENKSFLTGSLKFSVLKSSYLKLGSGKADFKPLGSDGSQFSLKVTIDGKECGFYRDYISVVDSMTNEEKKIEVVAQIVQPSLSILTSDKTGIFENANFGNLFYGQKSIINAFLVNPGPQSLSFSIRFDDDEDGQNNSEVGKFLSIFPTDGVVKPYTDIPLIITFAPIFQEPEKGFQKALKKAILEPVSQKRLAVMECLESNQTVSFGIEGVANFPSVSIVPSMLRFGDCPVNDRRDILLTLKNNSKLPVRFELPSIANFKFSPQSGRALPDENISIIASFIPPQLGMFKTTAIVVLESGLQQIELKLLGEANTGGEKKKLVGGVTKLPQDFATEFKFVNPEEEAVSRLERKRAKEQHEKSRFESAMKEVEAKHPDLSVLPPIIHASSESDDIYGTDIAVRIEVDPKETFKQQMLQFYQNHNAQYNDYLQKSAIRREFEISLRKKTKLLKKGAVDFDDPFGINMGMERGLDEPMLRIPPAQSSLYLSNGSSGAGSSSGGKSRLPVDENRLIQKKYESEPTTQAQYRDCATELTPDELKLVTASHKVIDFGKVCVGSLSAKNFVVFNGLKKAIRVKVDELEIELQQSKSLVQVIPEGCLAGFDIYFTSRSLGKLKRSFTWKINDFHSFKVHVVAEVVPIEIQMSKSELLMEFPPDSLKPTLSTDIILTNPGNAFADFLWGSAGAFTCDPEKGSIAPGKSAVITITWDPHASKRTEEEIGLHITGGIDQVLKVRGNLQETKAEFSEKKISLGTLAVGTEKEVLTSVSNIGDFPLVYFVNPIDPQLGIRVEPSEGSVMVKESTEIKLFITPKFAKSYDNVSITAKVRGGKSIILRLSGVSILPQIEFPQTSFKFGNVTVDSLARLPFSLINKSQIAATLLLDLTSFPDFAPSLNHPIDEVDLATKEFGPVPVVQEDEFGNHIVLLQQKQSKANASTDEKQSIKKTSRKKPAANCWKLLIPANSTLSADLIFHPSVAKKHSFKLPLQLLGVSDDKSLFRDVSASGISSVLSVSSYVVDFGDKVVSRDPLSRVSYFLETTLTNISQGGISFSIREEEEVVNRYQVEVSSSASTRNGSLSIAEPQQIFFVSPLKVDLAPGASAKLRVTFQPQESATYSKKLGIFFKDQDDPSKPYLSLLCVGTGVYPCMSFSTECVILPPVPLGIVSRSVFTVFNHGYAALEIKHRISPNLSVPLEVSYPDGNQVGIMTDRIRVIVSCKSDHPTSWTGKIEFYDMDGERFFLSVSGVVDNCLLTNYWFVNNYGSEFGFIGLEDQPVQFLPLPQIQELRQIEAKKREELRKLRSLERQRAVEGKLGGSETKSISSNERKKGKEDSSIVSQSPSERSSKSKKDTSFAELKGNTYMDGVDVEKKSTYTPEEIEAKFLLRWLNRTVCKRPYDVENFPFCVFENQGELLIETLELMSGKKINITGAKGLTASKPGESRQDDTKRASEKGKLIASADRVLFKNQQIVNFLVNNGALLSHINVIWLLNKEDYLLMLEHEASKDKSIRFTPAMWNMKKKQWDDQWLEFSRRAWLDVLLQAIKIFVLSRVSFKDYAVMPGIVLSSKTTSQLSAVAATKGKKQNQPFIPKDLAASNIFTHGEQVLLTWVSYHLDRAEGLADEGANANSNSFLISSNSNGLNKRVVDLAACFSDFFPFCQLFHSHVSDITQKGEPLSGYTTFDRSRIEEIFARFEECLIQYHVDIPGLNSDETLKSSRNIMLLVLHLFLNLPHLIPKTKIEFSGMLGTPIFKKIELKNPSKKPLLYSVTLKGSSDYSIERDQLIIPPESAVEFLVTLNARFMHSVISKIFFWNIKDSNYSNGPTLSFQCISQIRGIQPIEKVSKQINLFENETFSLMVKNPYHRDIVVKVKLEIRFCQKGLEEFMPSAKPKKKAQPEIFREIPLTKPALETDEFGLNINSQEENKNASADDWEIENMFRQPFWCNDETISIPKGSSKQLNVFMLPFQMGKYICQIIFVEPDLGEFSHEINAEVIYPKPSEKLSADLLQGSASKIQLSFNSKNSNFEKALSVVTEARIKNANKKIRARSVFTNFLTTKVSNEECGASVFVLDFTAQYFTYTKKFLLVSEYLKWSGKSLESGSNNVKLKKFAKSSLDILSSAESNDSTDASLNRNFLNFSPEKAGVYKTLALIHPEDNICDLRCIELYLTAKIPDVKMLLEFRGPARTKILQEIPIHNESDYVSLSVTLSGRNFVAPKIINVPPRNFATLEVSFFSLLVGNFEGKLQLKNSETGDIFDYQLVGMAEDPLAEDSLKFKCSARKKSVFPIPIPSLETLLGPISHQRGHGEDDNAYRSFLVESDLPFTQFRDHAKIPYGGGNFDIVVNSPMGGELSGFISFRDAETQISFWYAVVVDVSSPSEEKVIEVNATVRQAVVIEITLDNPLKDELVFDVSIMGDGLLGESNFTLQPKSQESTAYELIYSPLIAGSFLGKVSFWNELVGEVWYKLVLTALPAPAIEIPVVECMLGSEMLFIAPIENPLNEAVTFTVAVENSENFAVTNPKISLSPFEQGKFEIKFIPSTFQELTTTTIKLFNKKLGELVYIASGKGLLPGLMELVSIEGPLHEIASENVIFRNPFRHPLPIEVYLSSSSGDGSIDVFSLLLRKANEIVVPPKSPFHIPISFSPTSLGVWDCTLQIRSFVSGHNLLWCYPIQGMAEVGSVIKLPSMKTMSKSSLIKEHLIPLSGLVVQNSESNLSLSDFSITLKIEDNLKNLVTRSFKIQPLEVVFSESQSQSSEVSLRTRLLFEPLRLFSAKVEVSIIAKSRGKWKAVIDLEATNPEPDDIIKLVAKVGDSDRVSFKINNRFLGFSPFQAYFTTNSSPHFSVAPSSGLLAPFDGDGTSFVVTFSPKEYGYIEQATLNILTEDAQWSYQLKGAYPESTVHTSQIKSKISTKR